MRQPISVPASPIPQPELLRAAFRDLHAARLHGFAMLVSLGDRQLAAKATRAALAAGSSRIDELRHPERAAAWLRARAVRSLRPGVWHRQPARDQRLAALTPMGVDARVFAALATLSVRERAGVVAAVVEGLRPDDVATVLGRRSPSRARRDTERAVARYLATIAPARNQVAGPLAQRVLDVAARAFTRTAS